MNPAKKEAAVMRATILSLMTTVLIAAAAPSAQAHEPAQVRQVEAWYAHYLGRAAEPAGLAFHVQSLCDGTPALAVEASILSSTEYFDRNGGNDASFVIALYRDVLGVAPTALQLQHDVHQLQRIGNRAAFTTDFLQTRRVAPVPVTPPVVHTYRPYYVAPAPVVRPVVVPAPVFQPAYGYARPLPYGPAPAVAIGVRQSNFGFGVAIR
jgi:hypothetical protein